MALKKKPTTGMKDILPKEMEIRDYVIQQIKETYMNCMSEYGYTEEEFEEFFIKYLGEDEWNRLKERSEYVED